MAEVEQLEGSRTHLLATATLTGTWRSSCRQEAHGCTVSDTVERVDGREEVCRASVGAFES